MSERRPIKAPTNSGNRSCTFPGCGRPLRARKLCSGHYQQARGGRELRPISAPRDVGKDTPPCAVSVNGVACDRDGRRVKGMCLFHWRQQRKGVQFTIVPPRRPRGMAYKRDAEGRKQCGRCEAWRPEGEYSLSTQSPDGRQPWCRPCSVDHALTRRWGLTTAKLNELLDRQGGCGVCGTSEPRGIAGRSGWQVDHDHSCCPDTRSCGKCIRAVLCQDCNILLGAARDSIDILLAATAYLSGFEQRRHQPAKEDQ